MELVYLADQFTQEMNAKIAHLDITDQIVWATAPSPACCMELVVMVSVATEAALVAKEELQDLNANNVSLQVPMEKTARACVKIPVLPTENVIRDHLELENVCRAIEDILESIVRSVLQLASWHRCGRSLY